MRDDEGKWHTLGEDAKTERLVKKHLDKACKNKYFKRGYKAASKKKSRADNPYKLGPKIRELLKKRTFWDLGWEEKAYSKTPKQLRKIAEEQKKRQHEQERRERHERHEKRRKEKEKERRHRHGKHKH